MLCFKCCFSAAVQQVHFVLKMSFVDPMESFREGEIADNRCLEPIQAMILIEKRSPLKR